jgi:hypothetical protein
MNCILDSFGVDGGFGVNQKATSIEMAISGGEN